MTSCQYLVDELKKGLPKGETVESVGELVEVHRKALGSIKQNIGKSVLLLQLHELSRKYPAPKAEIIEPELAL